MIRALLTAAVLFACASWVVADEKGAKPGSSGPPQGKGWRKNETPAPVTPTPAPAPAPRQKAPAPKQPAPAPVARKLDGIGPIVSQWARSGIHGTQLAARIHQLQATRAHVTPPPAVKPQKKGKTEVAPTPPTPTPKKKGGSGGEAD